MIVRCSARTDTGLKRSINQDSYGIVEADDQGQRGPLLVICDGMGGHMAGEVASRLGVETILADYRETDNHSDPVTFLAQTFVKANQRIYTEGHGTMGTTGVAALIVGGTLHVANVGDSRAYLVRNRAITQISRDHSLIFDQIEAGILTPEQARHSNMRNIITRALGYQLEVKVDLFTVALLPGDVVLLSTDGLHNLVTDDELAEVVTSMPLDTATAYLIDKANERGGPDNITVVVGCIEPDPVTVGDDDEDATEPVPVTVLPHPQRYAQPQPFARPRTHERPLSRLGISLAALLLVTLIAAGIFTLTTPPLGQDEGVALTPTPQLAVPTVIQPTITP